MFRGRSRRGRRATISGEVTSPKKSGPRQASPQSCAPVWTTAFTKFRPDVRPPLIAYTSALAGLDPSTLLDRREAIIAGLFDRAELYRKPCGGSYGASKFGQPLHQPATPHLRQHQPSCRPAISLLPRIRSARRSACSTAFPAAFRPSVRLSLSPSLRLPRICSA